MHLKQLPIFVIRVAVSTIPILPYVFGCTVQFSKENDGPDTGVLPDGAECVDEDGDGYGEGCSLGPDCDDNAPGIVGSCEPSRCPNGWALVTAGVFEMGCSEEDECWADETAEAPRHNVYLDDFCIQRFEVSVADYRACRNAGICTGIPADTNHDSFCNWSPILGEREDHPINCITRQDARDYCRNWVGGDLPTEAEWEKAARGIDARTYPWGYSPSPNCELCNYNAGGGIPSGTVGCDGVTVGPGTWPVYELKEPGVSPFGLFHMAGNVYEWVQDCFDPFFYLECSGADDFCESPVNLCDEETPHRVIRGGAFTTIDPVYLRAVWRASLRENEKAPSVGFRCRHDRQ